MDVSFEDPALERLAYDPAYSAEHGDAIVRAYRKRILQVGAASDERVFYAHRSYRFEKLKGQRSGQYSMRLNDQWRLVIELRGTAPKKTVHVVEIVDYH